MRRLVAPLLVLLCCLVVSPVFADSIYLPLVTNTLVALPISPTPLLSTPTSTLLPTQTTAPTLTPTPTLTAPPIRTSTPTSTAIPVVQAVLSITHTSTFTVDPVQLVVGEVLNTGSASAYVVQVSIRFYNASNTLVATAQGYTYLSEIAPAKSAPFKVGLFNPPAGITRYDVSIAAQSSTSAGITYRPLTVVSQATRDNFGIEAFGEVRNDQTSKVTFPKVVTTFYAADGSVADTGFDYLDPDPLPAGATTIYQVSGFGQRVAGLRLVVQTEAWLQP